MQNVSLILILQILSKYGIMFNNINWMILLILKVPECLHYLVKFRYRGCLCSIIAHILLIGTKILIFWYLAKYYWPYMWPKRCKTVIAILLFFKEFLLIMILHIIILIYIFITLMNYIIEYLRTFIFNKFARLLLI